ncbi:hypothetical protein, partial [Enterococcus faecalis]|uniref:hypothetical protein n=1 Tax=Enterococcus faecalis TaxID=1351 RepID=UPI002477CCED
NNEDEEYEKMPDFENEQSMKAQPKVTEEASFDDEVVYAKEQAAKVKQVQQQVPTELSEESFSFAEKLEENQLYQQSIKKLTEQLLMQTNEVEALQKQVVEKDVQLKDVKETLSDKEATITSLQKKLSEAKIQQRQTSEENLDTAVTLSQKEIGEVLLEAKRQAKETIAQTNQQVATVHEEMEQRLATLTRMKQVAREYQAYCEQMLTIKNESTGMYQQIEQLLAEIKR